MILYKNGHALIGDHVVKTDIVANHGRIIEIAPDVVPDEQTEVVDCSNRYILPSLVDLCSYGAIGYDFNSANVDEMKKILEYYISLGVGTVFPTLKADADDNICRQLSLIAQLANDYPEIKGIHLDGPFVSPDCCNSPSELLQKPSMDKFLTYQKAAEGKIKLITVAPELENALPFITELTANKVTVSLGRSNADGETAEKAFKAGAKSVTDWGNNMSAPNNRDVGLMGSALLHDCFCLTTFETSHIGANVMNLLVKTKSADKIVGITADAENASRGLANLISTCNLPLTQAIKMWTVNSAKLVGLTRVGTIEINKDADFTIFG